MTSQDQLLVVILLWIMAPLLFVVLLAAPLSLLPVIMRGRRSMQAWIETARRARPSQQDHSPSRGP